MARLNEKTHIAKLDETIELPDGDNAVIVEDDETTDRAGWPIIVLESDIARYGKNRLSSNGTDFCHIRARCWLANGDVASVLPRRDTATPYDERRIRTSYWMMGPPRVYVKVGDSLGDEIAVESYSEREIVTAVDMERVPHYIEYDGCETVTFAVDQLANIAPSEVPVNTYAETKLTARAEGGGFATVTGTFLGQTATLVITIADPAIGAITAKADPATIDFVTPSTIVACVLTPDGTPVADGVVVTAKLRSGPGALESGSAVTATETIEQEAQRSSDEITVGVTNNITSVISVIADRNASYPKNYYGPGSSFDGKTITLSKSLPDRVSNVWVTYTAGGCAKFTYRSQQEGKAEISCQAGQENCLVDVTVSIAAAQQQQQDQGSGNPDITPPAHGISYSEWQLFKAEGVLAAAEAEIAGDLKLEDYIHNGPIEYTIISSNNCHIEINNSTGFYLLQVFADYDIVPRPYWGADGFVKGRILLKGNKNGEIKPIPRWKGQVVWSAWGTLPADLETLEDIDGDCRASYSRGRPGSHTLEVEIAPGYPVPQEEAFSLEEADIDTTGSLSTKEYNDVSWNVIIRWRAIYY